MRQTPPNSAEMRQTPPNSATGKSGFAPLHHQKRESVMADWKKAWAFTSGWEGPWDGGSNYIYSDSVAAYGVTPVFLAQQYGIRKELLDLAYMKAIKKSNAATIWFNSRWTWFQCASMTDDLAILVFDMAVRKPQYAVEILCEVTGMSGQTMFFRQNVTLPTQAVFDALNGMDAATAYAQIVTAYIKRQKPSAKGVIRRLSCLLNKRFELDRNSFPSLGAATRTALETSVTSLYSIKRKLVADRTMNDDSSTLWTAAKWIGGLWLGVKILKRLLNG